MFNFVNIFCRLTSDIINHHSKIKRLIFVINTVISTFL
nr:MAG TPA: hypothetical protein [Caudoviricetes sp.]